MGAGKKTSTRATKKIKTIDELLARVIQERYRALLKQNVPQEYLRVIRKDDHQGHLLQFKASSTYGLRVFREDSKYFIEVNGNVARGFEHDTITLESYLVDKYTTLQDIPDDDDSIPQGIRDHRYKISLNFPDEGRVKLAIKDSNDRRLLSLEDISLKGGSEQQEGQRKKNIMAAIFRLSPTHMNYLLQNLDFMEGLVRDCIFEPFMYSVKERLGKY